jgi:hypothetical protein
VAFIPAKGNSSTKTEERAAAYPSTKTEQETLHLWQTHTDGSIVHRDGKTLKHVSVQHASLFVSFV